MAQSYRLVSMDSQEIRDMLDNSENETDSKLTYMESIDLFRPSEHENEQMVPDEDEDESSSLSQDPNYQPGSDSEVEASLSENRNQDNVEIVTNTPKSGTGRKRSRGRPQNQVWLEFITVTRGKNFISNKCKHCKEQVSAQSSRMENHLKKCRKFNKTPVSQGLPTPISPPVGKESAATTKITNFMYKMLPRTKDKLNESLGKFIYSANLPFNVVENEYFCKFVGLLNPSYVLPKHETVGGFLLDNEFKRTELELTKQLENQKVVLAQDGWSTTQQEPVIAHSAICNGQSFFLGAEATGGSPKTAEFCYSLFEKQLKQLETINCEVVGLVTDNCNTMLALQNLVKKNNPNVIVYGCSPHLLNLVGQHYTNKELMDKVIQVQKYFRNHYYARADLKSSKGKRPVLPMPVRWNSQTDCCLSYLENNGKYLEIIRARRNTSERTKSERDEDDSVYAIISDTSLYDSVEQMIKLFSSVVKAIDSLQREDANLADMCQQWITIREEIPLKYANDNYFQEKMKMAMTDIAITAHMLHPHFKGNIFFKS
ncbi:hypothetical protein Fcan01_24234 [Folsomia candida]|uniref:DUF659 domain-containing protein n=1 Tax=Folsomia candida TaxID=158441 RepID=A0A226D7K2_FOLCA|nr:hypothetical protein Fcan01_24234 [Folsomia candida]